jgi:hypothetical protein
MRLVRGLSITTALALAAAAHDVARAGDAPRVIDAIENDLVADEPAVRAKAALELLGRAGAEMELLGRFPDAGLAMPMLVDLLDDESPDVAAAAGKTIHWLASRWAEKLAVYVADDSHWTPGSRLVDGLPRLLRLKRPTAADAFDPDRRSKKLPTQPSEVAVAALLSNAPESSAAPELLAAFRAAGDAKKPAAVALAMHGMDVLVARGLEPPEQALVASTCVALEMVKSRSDARSWAGATILARVGATDPAAASVLAQSVVEKKSLLKLGDEEVANRSAAAACRALGRIGPRAAAAAPVLLDVASKKETAVDVVNESARALVRIGKEADLVALFAKRPPTADLLAGVLASQRRAAATVVPYLAALLGISESGDGLEDLADYGPDAATALPAVKAYKPLDERDAVRRLDVVLAIAPTDADATKALDAAVRNSDERVRRDALDVLARRGAPGPALVARLQAACAGRPGRGPTIDEFCDALSRCGAAANAATPDLLRALGDDDKRCADPDDAPRYVVRRHDVAVALGKIGPDAAAAVPALTALRDKGDETIRVAAAQALRRIRNRK